MSDVYARLQALDITLPPLAVPAAAYVPYVQSGKLIFVSGHIAKKDGKPWVGQLGKNMDTAQGKASLRDHRRLFEHIRARDSAKAQLLILRHMDRARSYWSSVLGN